MTGYPGRGLHGVIVEKIGGRIVRGEYGAGELLHADTLEREFGASKTAVREALKVLAAKGLLDSRQRRGTFVLPRSSWSLLDPDLLRWLLAEPTRDFADDIAELRLIVEPVSARLAARRRNHADLAELAAALQTMDDAGTDQAAATEGEKKFHRALLAATHNELIGRLAGVAEAGVQIRERHPATSVPATDSVLAHHAVLSAIRARDEATAADRTRALLSRRNGAPRHMHPVPPNGHRRPGAPLDAAAQ